MVIDFCAKKAKKNELENKKTVILNCLINYYKDLKENGVNIPYFLQAKQDYNKLIKNNKDVNCYYNKLKAGNNDR